MTLYDMGRRITELVNRREQALSLLQRAPNDVYVRGAILALSEEPLGGEPGGPARDEPAQTMRKDAPLRDLAVPRPPKPSPQRRVVRPRLPPAEVQLGNWATSLTGREWQVAKLIATGMSNKEVGKALSLSVDTVKSHLQRAMQRCRVHNRTQLAALVLMHDEIEDVNDV